MQHSFTQFGVAEEVFSDNSLQRGTSTEQLHHLYTHNQMDWWKKAIKL